MKSFLHKITLDQLEGDLQSSINYLKEYNIEINKTRINTYIKDISELINVYRKHLSNKLEDNKFKQRIADSLFESSEWIRIAKGLRGINDPALVRKLKKFIKGPRISIDETTNSNLARNIGFELLLASRFRIAGYGVDLSSNCDIIVKDNSKLIFVECKRPLSEKKINKRVREAYDQLQERFMGSDENPYGLIAISIGKTLNPEQRIIRAKDEIELDKIMQSTVYHFLKAIQPVYNDFINIKILGIFGFLSVLTLIEGYDGLISSNVWGAVPLLPEGSSDDIYFEDLCKKLYRSLPN